MDLQEHILRKEYINMRESSLSDWREEIMEEGDHPYVDVMPASADEEGKKVKKEPKKKEEESTPEEEGGRKKLDLGKKK